MAMRDFIDKLRAPKDLAGPAISGPRAIFNRKRDRLLWLKISLPVLAIGIIGYLTYSSYDRQSDTVVTIPVVDDMPKLDAGMKVSGIAFEGMSKSERPFSVTALSAAETKGNKDLIDLEEPQAEIELSEITWIAITAEHGLYDRKLDRVDLTGAVTVYHDNGLTFTTEQAAMDLQANTASGTAPVIVSDDRRELSAEGFEMLDDGATVLFKGRSHLKILPKQKGIGE
ncbi:LPS export ABC transporter periplasmic protein LptC [Dongia mobilis]|uniref:LPS export ABC transporter periplasmic protein LptC n=1 Tax=Dongia sp. TaxID=1977262 RepID=UPI0026EC8882